MIINGPELVAQVRENRSRLDGCPKHLFLRPENGWRVGRKVTCAHCAGEAPLTYMGSYIAGYVAAGGAATDICPDWDAKKQFPDARLEGES
jgi:hypothetical protein